MNKIEKARQSYKPEILKYLLVAETPPRSNSNRFFYFENVTEQDSLFLETMKVLFPEECERMEIQEIRKQKAMFLEKFRIAGFYLVDALDEPFEEKYSSRQKINLILQGQQSLLEKIRIIIDENTKVILIAAPVFKANYEFLKKNGINVINKELIEFPGSGGQKKFRSKMKEILNHKSQY